MSFYTPLSLSYDFTLLDLHMFETLIDILLVGKCEECEEELAVVTEVMQMVPMANLREKRAGNSKMNVLEHLR